MGMLKNWLRVGDADAKQWPSAPRSRNRLLVVAALAASVAGAWGAPAHALLIGGPDIIAAPSSVMNSNSADVPPGATNTHQQAFNEQQGVVLTAPLAVDHGAIPAGTVVDSHMIFLNVPDGAPGAIDLNRTWTFDGPVLGVMSAANGSLEVSTSSFLGALGTAYPAAPFPARGLEVSGEGVTSEGYTVAGNSITVGMGVSQPGDWIRVITQGNRPPDCSAVTAGPTTLWAPNHELRTVTLSGVTDADGDSTTLAVTGVTQDEPVSAPGGGNAAPDAVAGAAPNQVQLRAERDGGGDGRVYRIAFTGTDSSGATCTGTATVEVPHDSALPAVASAASYNSFVP